MELKDPIYFAEILLKYCQDAENLPIELRSDIEKILSQSPALQELVRELNDSEEIGKKISFISSFDVEAALKKMPFQKKKKRHLHLQYIAASILAFILLCICTINYYVRYQDKNIIEQQQYAEVMKIGNGNSTLELASGEEIRLDTLIERTANDAILLKNQDGILKVKVLTENASLEREVNTVHVPYKGVYHLVLHDGTQVYLNSGSSLKFPSAFPFNERRVRLLGEAFFEVSPDNDRPFIVEASQAYICVLGTSFNVKAYEDEPSIYVTLQEGNVSVYSENSQALSLTSGEQAILDKTTLSTQSKKADPYLYSAWKDGNFHFQDAPLEDILKQLERWYNIKAQYKNPELKQVLYSGKMRMYDSVLDILRKFEKSGDLQFKLKGNTLIVSHK